MCVYCKWYGKILLEIRWRTAGKRSRNIKSNELTLLHGFMKKTLFYKLFIYFFTFSLSLSVRWCERTANKTCWIEFLVENEKAGPCRSSCLVQLNLCMTPKQTTCSLLLLLSNSLTYTRRIVYTPKSYTSSNEKTENKNVFSTRRQAHRHTSIQQAHTIQNTLVLTLTFTFIMNGLEACV